ncbi:MAG: peptide chain release factor N(5)-glutamine methyltransferase [Clostridia bacterium]|nr:peptide chain release factor N(5)-glutamine methyltransferase [Clostridia bacterium]
MKLSEAIKRLVEAGIPNAKHDAMEIFSDLGGIDKARMIFSDVEIKDEIIISAIEDRASRRPLQYIIGKAYFYNEEYEVNENCLIPRQDTEILVDFAVKNLPSGARFLDLCTGSGCVGISALKNTLGTNAVLVDISEAAIELSRRNAERNGVIDRAEFVVTDALMNTVDGEYFAVLSNPPYVKDSVYGELDEEIFHEPKMAFLGGSDGCDFYRSFTARYKDRITAGGFIAYEIGYDQGESLRKIAEENLMTCEIIPDFSGNDRVAVLRKSN